MTEQKNVFFYRSLKLTLRPLTENSIAQKQRFKAFEGKSALGSPVVPLQ